MARTTLGVVAGLAAWVIIASIAGLIMRGAWPEYASVADTMTFTLPMLFARLATSAFASLTAGLVTALIARRSMLARLMPAALLLVVFIPVHVMLWDKFPVWYHLTFLMSLVPLTYAGGMVAEVRALVPSQA
jgi:ammonia channel protein AmtB